MIPIRIRLPIFVTALVVILTHFSLSQNSEPLHQVVLDNDSVRVVRITLPPQSKFTADSNDDAVAVRLQDETATFIPKGSKSVRTNPGDHDVVDLLIELKKHWDAEVRPCSEPMKCTRETRLGKEVIAKTTTLFTNGFITGSTHKVVPGGTLDSSYYSAKGSDRIVVIPFTDLNSNFGGVDEALNAGQPYFSAATEVEVSGSGTEGRWFVLRLNSPSK